MSGVFDMCEMVMMFIATVAAAIGAIVAAWQLCLDRQWRKLDRTFTHSPTRNESFLRAIKELEKLYPDTYEMNVETLTNRIKDCNVVCNANCGHESAEIAPDNVGSVVLVANFWGQMATEYELGLIDKDATNRVLKTNFMKFSHTFHCWLNDAKRHGNYADTIKLYRKWKEEYK